MIFTALTIIANAQEKVVFNLYPDGKFKTKDGASYLVVKFDTLSSSQLYDMVRSNINAIYKNPKKVISEVENKSISVRGFSQTITTDKLALSSPSVYSGYYNLLFEFKDGKIKVNAPIIDEDIYDGTLKTKFEFIASHFFKNGDLKPKKKEYKDITELQLNIIINKILGLLQNENRIKDDW